MIRIRQVLYVIGFAMLFQAWAVAGQPLESVPSDGPDDKSIKVFTGKARMLYYSDPRIKQKALVSDRILAWLPGST